MIRPCPPAADAADRPDDPARRTALRAVGALGLLAAGCGGGTDVAGVGSGGTGQMAGTYSTGAISGFGSVILNGVRYDDSAARVTDDAGRTRGLGELAIGSVVEIEGRSDEASGLGVADRIRVISALRGTIAAIDAAAGRLVVLGVTVQAGTTTSFPDASGLAGFAVGESVEVHGFADVVTGVLRATLVERRSAADGLAPFRLRGTVAAVDAAAGTFRIGTVTIDARGSSLPQAALQVGATVAVEGTNPPSGASWRPGGTVYGAAASPAAGTGTVRIDGTVTAFESASRFVVAGLPVDAGSAAFPGGSATALRDGLRVRVVGTLAAGRVAARSVELRDDAQPSGAGDDEVEIRGSVVRFSRLGDFAMRDGAGRLFLVDASALRSPVDGGTLADLKVGTTLRVRGRRGTPVLAAEIRIER